MEWRNKVLYQSIPLKSTCLLSESVTLILISEILFDETGEYYKIFSVQK